MTKKDFHFTVGNGISFGVNSSPKRDSGNTIEFYGISPPLEIGERGAICTFELIEAYGQHGISMGPQPKIEESFLKTVLLFVEKIDVTSNPIISSGQVGELTRDLRSLGIATRSAAKPEYAKNYQEISQIPWKTYKWLNSRDPGRWSIWQAPDYPVIPENNLETGFGFQIELSNALIAPSATVPYDDILMFKEHHMDELTSLRHYLEEAAIKMSREGDERAITHELEKIHFSLRDYNKKSRQSNISKKLQSLTLEFDFVSALKSIVGGGASLLSTTFSAPLESITTILGSGIGASMAIKSAKGLKGDEKSPFRYIVKAGSEFS